MTSTTREPLVETEAAPYIVYVSTFPPRKCGIATFTADLTRATGQMFGQSARFRIVAMNTSSVIRHHYDRQVIFQIDQDNLDHYAEAAEKLNAMDKVKLVVVQHEFGIFGGRYGLNVIGFLDALNKPKVVNFHTVLPDPAEELRDVVCSLAASSDGVSVMTYRSKKILTQDYSIPSRKVHIIPHGIPDGPYTSSRPAKASLGFSDRTVLSTFGLLSRGKGLEYVIEALPGVANRYTDFTYLIIGATHPDTLREEGESYRNSLIRRIDELGLHDHVKFFNRYLPANELMQFLKATDIYVSTSLDPDQAVSGTLSYALGTGRPVISTAFAQAREDVTSDVGLLVDFRSPEAFTDAILRLLADEAWRTSLGKNAYFKTRNRTWPNIAVKYSKLFAECAPELSAIVERKRFPKVKLDHLIRLTDRFGIIRFADLSRPDVSSGYTLDDNARALMVVVNYLDRQASGATGGLVVHRGKLLELAETYLSFIEFVSKPDGWFDNVVSADRTIDSRSERAGSHEETTARALYALGLMSTARRVPKNLRDRASAILWDKLAEALVLESPRAVAWYIKALCILAEKGGEADGVNLEQSLRAQCDWLVRCYEKTHAPDWEWYEEYLTYSNGVMPEALLRCYRVTGKDMYLKVGKATLDFLVHKEFRGGTYVPVGQNGWHRQGTERSDFDQKPEEATAMVHALQACHFASGDQQYATLMRRVFNWFLGDNILDETLYDRSTGGCYDGVGKKNANLNQGAEATISYLLARLMF